MLPCAIVTNVLSLPNSLASTDYAIIFRGALVFDFLGVGVTLLIWIHKFPRGEKKSWLACLDILDLGLVYAFS